MITWPRTAFSFPGLEGYFPMSDLMTVIEVAEQMKASSSFVYNLLSSGELRHYRLGKAGIRVSPEQLQAYLDARERGGVRVATPKKLHRPLKNLSLD